MFAGIVEEVGRVVEAKPDRLVIQAAAAREGIRVGDSVNVNGACLTAVEVEDNRFTVDVTPETLRRTNLGALKPGDAVDLERALAVTDRIGGHIVQGHVEATGKVISIEPEGDSLVVRFQAPPQVMRYVVGKGFIAVDGISLTVVDRDSSSFSVSVIPYTRDHTVLGSRQAGDQVNLETDIVARYVEQFVNPDFVNPDKAS